MATTTLSVAQNSVALNAEYWSKRLQQMIKLEAENFVFSTLGEEASIPLNEGTTTYKVRRYNSLPVRSLTASNGTGELLQEGSANTALIPEVHTVQGSVDQYGAYMEITDRVKDIHMDDIKSIYQPELARHAAEVRERVVMSKFTDTSVYFVGGVASDVKLAESASGVLSMKDLRKVALFQKINKRAGHRKFGGKPVGVLHPNVMADLLDDSDLKDRLLNPGQENMPIKIGTLEQYQFYGMYVIETLIAEVRSLFAVLPAARTKADLTALQALTSAAVAVGDIYRTAGSTGKLYKAATVGAESSTWTEIEDINIYTSYVLGRDPYVVLKLGSGSVEWKATGFEAEKNDPLGQKATFGYKMWVGAKVLDPLAIVKVYSKTAYDVGDLASFSFVIDGSETPSTTDPFGATSAQS